MTNTQLYTYIGAMIAIVICVLLLTGIGLAVTRRERPQLVPEHSPADRYWYRHHPIGEGPTEALRRPHRPRHLDTADTRPGVITPEMERWPATGRRAVTSLVRHIPVASDWRPVTGSTRIALLETPTAEYLFARRPKDQLNTTTPRFIRAYMYAG